MFKLVRRVSEITVALDSGFGACSVAEKVFYLKCWYASNNYTEGCVSENTD